jgi:hypothetical protein
MNIAVTNCITAAITIITFIIVWLSSRKKNQTDSDLVDISRRYPRWDTAYGNANTLTNQMIRVTNAHKKPIPTRRGWSTEGEQDGVILFGKDRAGKQTYTVTVKNRQEGDRTPYPACRVW